MSEINSEIRAKDINFNILKASMLFYIDLLKKFQTEPDKVIKKIADGELTNIIKATNEKINNSKRSEETTNNLIDEEMFQQEFADFKKGLEGEFTKATAIAMAKSKLISYLEKSLNDFSNEYKDIEPIITSSKEQIKEKYNIVDANVNIVDLQGRKERYHRSNLERDFMQKTIIKVLTDKLVKSSLQTSPKDFLQKILEVLAIIRTFEFVNLNKNITLYYNRCCVINENFKDIGVKGLFNPDITNLTNELDQLSGEQEFNKILTSINIKEDLDNDVVDLLDLTIDDLEATIAQVKLNIEKLNMVYEKFTPSEYTTKYFVNKILTDVITPYNNSELTDEKFFSSLLDSLVILENTYLTEIDLLRFFSIVVTKLDNYIYIYSYIYGACEDCSIRGTLISKDITVNNVGK